MNADSPVRGPYPVTRPRDITPEAVPGAGEVAVVNLATGLTPLPKGQRPTSGMNFFKRPKEEYWIVDTRVRATTLEFELDSADQGLSFHGTAKLNWCVDSVQEAVETAPFSVTSTLESWLVPALNSLARQYGMGRVGELEERVLREWPGWFGGSELLRVDGLTCRLRPDPAVTDLIRGGTLDDIRRGQAGKVLDGGRRGLMEEMLAKDPQAAAMLYADLREDEREQLRIDLEMIEVLADSAEDHQKAALANALLGRIDGRGAKPSLGRRAGADDGGADEGEGEGGGSGGRFGDASGRRSGGASGRRGERRRDRRMRGEAGEPGEAGEAGGSFGDRRSEDPDGRDNRDASGGRDGSGGRDRSDDRNGSGGRDGHDGRDGPGGRYQKGRR